jgi:pimeloyl-ACP methyl ester carboxylesterase
MARGALPYSSSRPSLEYLSHLGPHRVCVGELSAVGVPGVVFAPRTGPRCPAVVFGHGYLQPVGRYADTLRYLASWGFGVAAPTSGRGPVPSHAGMALDMSRVLDRLADAKLGGGRVTVDRTRLAVAGHGIGGGAAVLAAAAAAPPVQAVVTVSAARVTPSAVHAARTVMAPGLHLVGTGDKLTAEESDGQAIARAWAGPVQLRRLKGAGHLAVTEGLHWTSFFLGEAGDQGTQRAVRELMTAFLLLHVAGQSQLAESMDGKVAGTRPVELKPKRPVGHELEPA